MNLLWINILDRMASEGGTFLMQSTVLLGIGLLALKFLYRGWPMQKAYLYRALLLGCVVLIPLHLAVFREYRPNRVIASQPRLIVPAALGLKYSRVRSFPQAPDSNLMGNPVQPLDKLGAAPNPNIPLSTEEGLATAWLVGILLNLGGLAVAVFRLRDLQARCRAVTEPRLTLLKKMAQDQGITCPGLYETSEVGGAFLAGTFAPKIFLPAGQVERICDLTLQITFLHELAHLKARDCAWTVVTSLVRAIFWFQPLLWILATSLEQASEEAADAQVLSTGLGSTEYAKCLLELANSAPLQPSLRLARVGVAESKSSVGKRIKLILNSPQAALKKISAKFQAASYGVLGLSVFGVGCLFACSCRTVFESGGDAISIWPSRVPVRWNAPEKYIQSIPLVVQKGWSSEVAQFLPVGPGPVELRGVVHGAGVPNHKLIDQMKMLSEIPISFIWTGDGHMKTPPASVEKIKKLESGDFFALYKLSCIHRDEGQGGLADEELIRSLEVAPAVLAQKMQFEDGRPVRNMLGFSVSISYPSGTPTNGQTFTAISYPFATDPNGYFYLPVLKGEVSVGSQSGRSYVGKDPLSGFGLRPIQSPAIFGNQGDPHLLIGDAKVAVLPPLIVARNVLMVGFHPEKSSLEHPDRMDGDSLKLKWHPYENADHYRIFYTEWTIKGKGSYEGASRDLLGDQKLLQTELSMPLSAPKPLFNPHHVYEVLIEAQDKLDRNLGSSQELYFTVPKGEGPLALTAENLRLYLPASTRSLKFERGPDHSVRASFLCDADAFTSNDITEFDPYGPPEISYGPSENRTLHVRLVFNPHLGAR